MHFSLVQIKYFTSTESSSLALEEQNKKINMMLFLLQRILLIKKHHILMVIEKHVYIFYKLSFSCNYILVESGDQHNSQILTPPPNHQLYHNIVKTLFHLVHHSILIFRKIPIARPPPPWIFLKSTTSGWPLIYLCKNAYLHLKKKDIFVN